eukprot:sb/3472909/
MVCNPQSTQCSTTTSGPAWDSPLLLLTLIWRYLHDMLVCLNAYSYPKRHYPTSAGDSGHGQPTIAHIATYLGLFCRLCPPLHVLRKFRCSYYLQSLSRWFLTITYSSGIKLLILNLYWIEMKAFLVRKTCSSLFGKIRQRGVSIASRKPHSDKNKKQLY